MNYVTKLVYKRQKCKLNFTKKIYTKLINLAGADIPVNVKIGKNVSFCHNCLGTVIYENTIIEDNVRIYQNVTIGLKDPYGKEKCNFVVKENACICAGAKILGKDKLIIGKNSLVAANAVVLNSIGDNEVWAGVPAKKLEIKKRGGQTK